MSHLLIADAKNRLQFAEKWVLIMIKKPHAEETVTGIPVIQQSVSKRIKVIPGSLGRCWVEDLLRVLIRKIYRDNVLKFKLVCEKTYKEVRGQIKTVNQKCP